MGKARNRVWKLHDEQGGESKSTINSSSSSLFDTIDRIGIFVFFLAFALFNFVYWLNILTV